MIMLTDTILKSLMIAGIVGYLLLLEYNPQRRDIYLYPTLDVLLFVVINLLVWKLKMASLPVLIGFDLFGLVYILRGIKEYREEDEGRDELRRFEDMRSQLVRAVLNKKLVVLIMEDGSEHLFQPDKLIKYGIELSGLEVDEERRYRLDDIKEIREQQ